MAYAKTVEFAEMLYNAGVTRRPVDPLTDFDPGITVADAYSVQLRNVERWKSEGKVVRGKKIGLTSKGIQAQLGVNEPDYGHLFEGMDHGDGLIPTDEFIQPKIEAEIAFILKADLTGGNVTENDVLDATGCVAGAFEIVDSRVRDWRIKLPDTVADNASAGCFVLGTKRISVRDIDLSSVTMKLYKNGDLAGEGTGAAVLGNPASSVAWLSNKLWEYGVPLRSGEIILSGAITAAPPAAKGDSFEACFSEFGVVKARFV